MLAIMAALRAWIGFRLNPNGKYRVTRVRGPKQVADASPKRRLGGIIGLQSLGEFARPATAELRRLLKDPPREASW